MLNVHGEWPLVGRDSELRDVRRALLDSEGHGAILTGQSGVGKTALAQRIARQLGDEFDLVYVRGSSITAKIPYGALSFVLSDLDDAIVDNPLMLLRGLQELYEQRPDGRQTLILADNVEDLDPSSCMAISHLVRVSAVKLLAVCQSIDGAPEEFYDLWKDEVLQRIDLAPLGLAHTTTLLAAALDAPVSRAAAVSMWQTSGGNPLFLQALTREQIDSGEMLERDGVWVANAQDARKTRRSVADWITVRIRRLPADQREVVELVSVVGVIPLELLLRFVQSGPVDELQRSKFLELELGDRPLVRIANRLVGEVIRAQVPLGKSRELLRALAAESHNWDMPPISRMTYAAWCLDCGADIDADSLIEAGQLANRHFQPAAALRFVRSIPGYRRLAPAVIEEARALGIYGDVDGALQVLDDFTSAGHAIQTSEWVSMGILQCRLMVQSHTRYAEAAPRLAQLRGGLLLEASAGSVEDLVDTVESFAVELAVHEGRYADIMEDYAELSAECRNDHRPSRHEVCGWLAEAMAVTGRQEDAVRLCTAVVSRVMESSSDLLALEAAQTQLFKVLVLSGQWDECLIMLEGPGTRGTDTIYDGSASEFAEGCLLAYAGRGTEALDKLLPALSQLHVSDRHQLLGMAEAATAYAYALVGEVQASQQHLAALERETTRLGWLEQRSIRYFAVLASTAILPPLEVAQHMLDLADEDRLLGNPGHELMFLCQAVQHGMVSAADRLASSARSMQGPLAEVCALYGKGIASRDVHQVLLAAQRSADIGNYRLASDAAREAVQIAQSTGDHATVSAAEKVLRDVGAPGVAGRRNALDLLTERERSIAVLVSQSRSNREIADVMFVSVRTVEGHVYRIFSKLGVSSRSQLALLLE
ncbi:LuxR C-terminal-related transcriptional regulator [Arthrobacter sp. H5]|uniref:helix-turn-helix transcriptional regulator n=1 Tax=Arthrobacter sp. H5 TaxID=1267973 RepID=UPI0004878F0E|nr:LuxR C-terminal-related transcriptional regulator [Arthrobacter sp. H5]